MSKKLIDQFTNELLTICAEGEGAKVCENTGLDPIEVKAQSSDAFFVEYSAATACQYLRTQCKVARNENRRHIAARWHHQLGCTAMRKGSCPIAGREGGDDAETQEHLRQVVWVLFQDRPQQISPAMGEVAAECFEEAVRGSAFVDYTTLPAFIRPGFGWLVSAAVKIWWRNNMRDRNQIYEMVRVKVSVACRSKYISERNASS